MGLSIRAYAAHRGVSHTSVRKAIASGRLTPEADGTIDPVKADRAWVRNADPSKARDSQKLRRCRKLRWRPSATRSVSTDFLHL